LGDRADADVDRVDAEAGLRKDGVEGDRVGGDERSLRERRNQQCGQGQDCLDQHDGFQWGDERR